MKQLWAPWRIEYILSKKGPGCVFCDLPGEARDRENLILYRGEHNFIIMNRFPYNGGHLMVVPYVHKSSFEGLSPETLGEMMELARICTGVLWRVMHPEGFNTGINIGEAAGAGIEEHLHMHVVPRWAGDSSFMAVLDEVRVVPEHLLSTYDKLYPEFNADA
jgi:ATP adenylyltransferase